MSKILITGGAGFIGSHLSEKLVQRGEEVVAVDNLSTGSVKNIEHLRKHKNFHFVEGSVLDEKLMTKEVNKAEQVYHLAAAVGVKKVLEKQLDCLLVNIRGTEIVLQEAGKNKAKVLITSTSEVCGKSGKVPFSEEDDRTYGSVYKARWIYAFSKGVDELLGLAYHREKGLPVVIVRLFNVIGPRQTGEYGMVVPTFVRQALKGEPVTVFGDGDQTRCFADVDDITDALIKLMDVKEAEGRVLHLGSDKEISINDLAATILHLTDRPSESRKYVSYEDAYPEGGYEDFRRRVPDLAKVRALIAFEPKIPLSETVRKIIEYQSQQLE